MNTLDNFLSLKMTQRMVPDKYREERMTRAFGRDITNVQRRTSNISFVEKPVRKCQIIRIRSNSLRQQEQPSLSFRGSQMAVVTPSQPTSRDILAEYENDLAKSLLQLDCCYVMTEQNEITQRMRAILFDWLIDVHHNFKMCQQTLHICFRLFDEYSSKEQIAKSELQLVGITCLWIASKYEDIYPPRKKHFVEVTANTYTGEQMMQMESKILQALKFQLVKTTPYEILQLALKGQIKDKIGSLCLYLIEMGNVEGLTKKYKPSEIVFGAVELASAVCKTVCPQASKLHSVFPTDNDKKCGKEMFTILNVTNKYGLKASKKKYSLEQCHGVSRIRLEINPLL